MIGDDSTRDEDDGVFDDSFILPGSLDMYPYAFARNNIWQGEVTAQKGWSAFHRVGPAEQGFQDRAVDQVRRGAKVDHVCGKRLP